MHTEYIPFMYSFRIWFVLCMYSVLYLYFSIRMYGMYCKCIWMYLHALVGISKYYVLVRVCMIVCIACISRYCILHVFVCIRVGVTMVCIDMYWYV